MTVTVFSHGEQGKAIVSLPLHYCHDITYLCKNDPLIKKSINLITSNLFKSREFLKDASC